MNICARVECITFLKERIRALLLGDKLSDLEIWQVGAKFWDVRCTCNNAHRMVSFRTVLFSYQFTIVCAHFADLFWILVRVVNELVIVFFHLLNLFVA